MRGVTIGLASFLIAAFPAFAAPPERCAEPPADLHLGDFSPAALQRAFKDAPSIVYAMGKGRRLHLARLLARGADPNVCIAGISVLALSAMGGDSVEITMLLDGGALLDRPLDAGGGTALLTALGSRQYEVAKLLLDRGANPLHVTDGGTSALHQLAMTLAPADELGRQQQLDWAERLLDLGLAVDVRNGFGATPLMLATAMRNRGLAEFLLARGADPEAKDSRGSSASAIARQRGDADWLALFERVPAP